MPREICVILKRVFCPSDITFRLKQFQLNSFMWNLALCTAKVNVFCCYLFLIILVSFQLMPWKDLLHASSYQTLKFPNSPRVNQYDMLSVTKRTDNIFEQEELNRNKQEGLNRNKMPFHMNSSSNISKKNIVKVLK